MTAPAPWDLRAPEERDWFARFGDGVVWVVPPQAGGPPVGGRPQLPHGGAWVHVGADGVARGFSGKVEVGQGTRLALAMLVAEELRAPLASVRMIMGDTDVTPWDLGTFGSLGMPAAGPLVRAAAAAARGWLCARGAAALGVGAAEVQARGGRVETGDGARGVTFAELVRGARELHVVTTPPALTPAAAWTVAGVPTIDPDAIAAVTGARTFVTDVRLPGMLHGAILRPPRYGATLASVDVAAARARPGVTVLVDGELVAVAAPTPLDAAAALAAIDARWDAPPQPAAAELADYLRAHPSEGEGFWGASHHEVGDVDGALAAAATTHAATYTTAYVAHVPLEPRCAVAAWDAGRVTVWLGTQTPFMAREEIAEALGVAPADVRVIVPATGGGFGGKHAGEIAAAAAALARAAGAPVRVAASRHDETVWGYLRPMAVIDVRAGLDAGGALTAWTMLNVNSGSQAVLTPYRVAHQRIDHQPAASPAPQGSFRALAATANNFAREVAMDELARLAGADPLAFRLAHLDEPRLAAVLEAAAARAGWAARARAPGRGWGLACGVEKNGRVATIAEVLARAGGPVRVERLVIAFECGAVVNPDNLRAQIEGCAIMGLGGALFEEARVDRGVITNAALAAYRLPRFADVPRVDVVMLDRKDLPPAGGGETPIIAIAPAIASAIFDACGVRLRALPLAPDGTVPAR